MALFPAARRLRDRVVARCIADVCDSPSGGSWELMGHGTRFAQFPSDRGDRGHDQFGSINWVMGMAHRNVGAGRLGLRGMFSFEPWTIRGCGYPDLLATGERCNGSRFTIDSISTICSWRSRRSTTAVGWLCALAGVRRTGCRAGARTGRVSAPHLGHAQPARADCASLARRHAHHFRGGHRGVYGTRWKAEASAFNGREPDEERTGFDLAPLDSVSGRVWFLPTANLAMQVSAGQLTEAEPGEDGEPASTSRESPHRPHITSY